MADVPPAPPPATLVRQLTGRGDQGALGNIRVCRTCTQHEYTALQASHWAACVLLRDSLMRATLPLAVVLLERPRVLEVVDGASADWSGVCTPIIRMVLLNSLAMRIVF